MWVAIGENLVSNQQIIGIIKHANGKSTPDAMGRLGKTDPPAIATTSVNLIFGDGSILETGQVFLIQSPFNFIMFKINL